MGAEEPTLPRDARAPKRARWAWCIAQGAATLGLLVWAYTKLDFSRFERNSLAPRWLALALLCTLPAFAAAALRWSYTAQRLGVPLSFRRALPEVYLAGFLNSLLPTGVAGDLLRAARHQRSVAEGHGLAARAWLAVLLERSFGQLLLWFVLWLSLPYSPALAHRGFARWSPLWLALGLSGLVAMIVQAARSARSAAPYALAPPSLGPPALWPAVRRATLSDGALAVQLSSSALVLASCVLGFAFCAKGLSVPLSFMDLLCIVPPVLALSALPISVGGFGVREAASATLYAASGLDAATGVAVATVYGLLNLLGSAPGALIVWLNVGATRER